MSKEQQQSSDGALLEAPGTLSSPPSTLPYVGIFTAEPLRWLELPNGNWEATHESSILDIDSDEDVTFTGPERWACGSGLFSRLFWADHVRNTRIAWELEKKEPALVLDLACGKANFMARAIAGMGIDTGYVGVDINQAHAHGDWLGGKRTRRPQVGIAMAVTKELPFKDDSFDAVMCLEGVEHIVATHHDLSGLLSEVKRVLKRWGIIYLATPVTDGKTIQHPHCHAQEFTQDQVHSAISKAGLALWQCWNYRARPQVAKQLRMVHSEKGEGFPPAMVDAFMLPRMTYNELVPGNAVYMIGHPRPWQ